MSHVKHFLAQLAVLVETTINPIKPKTVQFSYRICFTLSYNKDNKNYDGCADA